MNPPSAVPRSPSAASQAQWLEASVQPHEPAVRGYLRHTFPSIDPDDVVQESYLRLLRTDSAGKVESAKAYFFSIARNTARKIFRRREKLFSATPVNELPEWRVLEGGPDAAESADATQRLELVAEAIDRLPRRCGDVLRLALAHGLATAEIAAKLGVSEATVRVQMARGIARCVEFMRERGEVK